MNAPIKPAATVIGLRETTREALALLDMNERFNLKISMENLEGPGNQMEKNLYQN